MTARSSDSWLKQRMDPPEYAAREIPVEIISGVEANSICRILP